MSTLRTQIHSLASKLAQDLLDAVRSSPLEDLAGRAPAAAAPTSSPARRSRPLRRRSPVDIANASEKIVELVSQHPNGLLAEELRKKSGLSRRALFTPLTHALASGGLKKKGEKRKTTYFAPTRTRALPKPGRRS